MQNLDTEPANDSTILKGAVISGIINAVINGTIQWYLLAEHAPLPLIVDGITSEEHRVFGAAVPLAVSLAMIFTAVAYTTVKVSKPPFYPTFLWMTVKHGFFALGVIITFAVLWQRIFGSLDPRATFRSSLDSRPRRRIGRDHGELHDDQGRHDPDSIDCSETNTVSRLPAMAARRIVRTV